MEFVSAIQRDENNDFDTAYKIYYHSRSCKYHIQGPKKVFRRFLFGSVTEHAIIHLHSLAYKRNTCKKDHNCVTL